MTDISVYLSTCRDISFYYGSNVEGKPINITHMSNVCPIDNAI